MKTLCLVRHAKSSKDDPSLADHDRPLNERGLHDAPMMGKRLAERDLKPDLIVSSPATRALTTAQLVAKELGYRSKDIVRNERLYASDAGALLAVIHALDDKLEAVMLFGHNPEFSELAQRLSGGRIADMPTCAVVELRYGVKSWSQIGEVGPDDVMLDTPK